LAESVAEPLLPSARRWADISATVRRPRARCRRRCRC